MARLCLCFKLHRHLVAIKKCLSETMDETYCNMPKLLLSYYLLHYNTAFERKRFGTVCMPYFRIARDPTAAALADPYLGQSIGPVPGYGVSFIIHCFFR